MFGSRRSHWPASHRRLSPSPLPRTPPSARRCLILVACFWRASKDIRTKHAHKDTSTASAKGIKMTVVFIGLRHRRSCRSAGRACCRPFVRLQELERRGGAAHGISGVAMNAARSEAEVAGFKPRACLAGQDEAGCGAEAVWLAWSTGFTPDDGSRPLAKRPS